MANRSKSKNANRSSLNNENITIDAKHSEMMKYFNTLQTSTDSLKNELKKLASEYNNKDNSKKNDIEYILYRDNLRDKINEIKGKINSINNNEEINKYYLDVGILLHNYYENIELSKNITNSENFEENLINYDESDIENDSDEDIEDDVYEINKKDEDSKKNYKSVLNFFNNRESNDIIESKNDSDKNKVSEDIEINKNDGNYASLKISDFVKEELTFKKKNILEEYLQKIDSNYITKIKVDINICKCSNCNLEMTVYPSDGIQICENCGIQNEVLIESDKPSFKDPPMEVCYFSYKRINHYNEFPGINDKKAINELIFKFLINFNLINFINKIYYFN
jgi:hypothetical protein